MTVGALRIWPASFFFPLPCAAILPFSFNLFDDLYTNILRIHTYSITGLELDLDSHRAETKPA